MATGYFDRKFEVTLAGSGLAGSVEFVRCTVVVSIIVIVIIINHPSETKELYKININ